MKKLLAVLFIFGFLFVGIEQVHASLLSDTLLKIKNLQREIASLKVSLKGSVADIPEPPKLGSTAVVAVTEKTVTLSSSVISLGFPASLTQRGTCYGLAASEGPMNHCLSDGGNGTGSFSQIRSDLIANTNYVAISYATNGTATNYGSTVYFKTLAASIVPSTCTATLSANPTTITLGGTTTLSWTSSNCSSVYISEAGGTMTSLNGSKVVAPRMTTSYDLTARVSSTNFNKQTVRVTVNPVTVTEPISRQIATISSPTSASKTSSSVVMSANVTSLGTPASISDRGICYRADGPASRTDYLSTCVKATGTGTGVFSVSVTDLQPSTTYNFIGYASHEMGPAMTSQGAFTTLASTVPSTCTATLSASPTTITLGGTTTLSWTTNNCSSVYISEAGGTMTSLNGSKVVAPSMTTSYDLTARASSTEFQKKTVRVTVTPASTAPSITVLSPNGGEVYQAGQQITVTWKSSNYSPSSPINISIGYSDSSIGFVGTYTETLTTTTNTGSQVVNLPTLRDPFGIGTHYKIFVSNSSDPLSATLVDQSDNYFTINSTQTTGTLTGVTLSKNTQVGQTLTTTLSPANASATYSWLRKDLTIGSVVYIPGATSSSYTLTSSDLGKLIFVIAKGSNGYTGGETGNIRDTTLPILADSSTCTAILSASPTSIIAGGSTTLSWSTNNCLKAYISDVGTVGLSGTKVVTPSMTTSYDLTAQTSSSEFQKKTVRVEVIPASSTCTAILSASPTSVIKGGSTTLSWSTNKCLKVYISDVGAVGLSGTKVVTPSMTTSYDLTAQTSSSEFQKKTVRVEVIPASSTSQVSNTCDAIMFTSYLSAKARSRGVQVESLQILLNDKGYLPKDEIDGGFGAKTRRALMSLQAANGMKVDGVVGTQTRILLNSLWGNKCLTDQANG